MTTSFGRVNGSASPVTTHRGPPAVRQQPVIPSRSEGPSRKPLFRPGDGFETQPTTRRPPVSLQVPQAQAQVPVQGSGRTFNVAEFQRTGGAVPTESSTPAAASAAQPSVSDKQAYLNDMYQQLLGRAVDGAGLETFSGEIDRMSAEGKPLEQITAFIEEWIKGSSEYQARNGGTAPASPGSSSTAPTSGTPSSSGVSYDGSTAAAGTTNVNAWEPVTAPEQGSPSARNAATYDNVINQFAVGSNPRYQPREGNTYCNIFAWDVTKAMGAELPHWVDANGNATAQGQGRELDANATNAWLNQHGAKNGWRKVSAEEAQAMANQGHPTVASWDNQGGIGHIAVVRPGEVTGNGPAIAQAGSECFNDGHVYDSFPRGAEVEYWVNDQG